MNLPLDIETDSYDAVICSGSFSYCHIIATAFDELVRITKPGGFICFLTNTEKPSFSQKLGFLFDMDIEVL